MTVSDILWKVITDMVIFILNLGDLIYHDVRNEEEQTARTQKLHQRITSNDGNIKAEQGDCLVWLFWSYYDSSMLCTHTNSVSTKLYKLALKFDLFYNNIINEAADVSTFSKCGHCM